MSDNVLWGGLAAVEIIFVFMWIWALTRLLGHPAWAWEGADKNRPKWLLYLILALFLPGIGYVFVLTYIFSVDTQVSRVHKLGPEAARWSS